MSRPQYDRAQVKIDRWDSRTFAPPTATAILALAEAVLALTEALHALSDEPPAGESPVRGEQS